MNTIETIASSSSSAAVATEMHKSVSFSDKSADMLNSTAWGDTVVKLRVHGQSETTNQIISAFQDFCPLEYHNAKYNSLLPIYTNQATRNMNNLVDACFHNNNDRLYGSD
ncbi:unnamed protein product [Trichobilharzia regenti]|nr:unnamed protein product [Trichobilharzia regenti]